VAKLQSDVAAANSKADQANSTAQSASQAASGAQSTANQAFGRCPSRPVGCGRDEREDRPHVQALDLQVSRTNDPKPNAALTRGVFCLNPLSNFV